MESKIETLEHMVLKVMDFLSLETDNINIYDFIQDKIVRRKLELDYVLMQKTPASNFDTYCQYAFFQIENLLNFYYCARFKDKAEDAKLYFQSKADSTDDLNDFESLEYRVSKIPYNTKFFKFSEEFLGAIGVPKNTSFGIQDIAYVRNSSIHRNSEIDAYENDIMIRYKPLATVEWKNISPSEKKIKKLGGKISFKRQQNFSKVKSILLDFVALIKLEIEKIK